MSQAVTLDEATLRRVFPEAPVLLDVPEDVGEIYSARLKAFRSEHQLLVSFLGGAVLVGLLLGFAASWVLGGVVLGIVVVTVSVILFRQHSKASDDFFGLYSTARGLTHSEDSHIGAGVPLFAKGNKREWPRVMSGTIANQRAQLGHYTYSVVSHDSDGNRQETDYDFTVLRFELPPAVAARFVGVSLSPKSISFGAVQDKLAHDRGVDLESIDFQKRYSLRVVDSQDDIALYELFSTPFVHRLTTELTAYWEQRGSDLVVWCKGHEKETADLDRFCLHAWHVLHRYLEEYQ